MLAMGLGNLASGRSARAFLRFDKALIQGIGGSLGASASADLSIQIGDVAFYGTHADAQ